MATGTTVQDAKWQHRSFTPNPAAGHSSTALLRQRTGIHRGMNQLRILHRHRLPGNLLQLHSHSRRDPKRLRSLLRPTKRPHIRPGDLLKQNQPIQVSPVDAGMVKSRIRRLAGGGRLAPRLVVERQ